MDETKAGPSRVARDLAHAQEIIEGLYANGAAMAEAIDALRKKPCLACATRAMSAAPAHSQPTPEIVSLKAALAVERAAREMAERDVAAAEGRERDYDAALKRIEALEGALRGEMAVRGKMHTTCGGEGSRVCLVCLAVQRTYAALASLSEGASQPTPEARVDLDMAALEGAIEDAEFYNPSGDYSRAHAALARRSAPKGQQQEAGAAPPAAPKHEEWCALYGDPEKGESCDCAAAPPSAPQEGLFKEGWEAGREAAALLFVEDAERFRAEADRALAMDLTVLAKMHMGDAAECLREAGRIRALPLPESALLTKDAKEAVAPALRDVAAYILDRADQYETDSPCWVALADVAHNLMRGEVTAAERNGDLDTDLYARVDAWAAPAPVETRLNKEE